MAQYFENDESLSDEQYTVHFQINGHPFQFVTLPGVFSNRHLDMGSRLLIEQILKINLTGTVLDLGCGYGCIGLTIKYFNRSIDMSLSDINLRACTCTRMNSEKLGLDDVNVIESDSFSGIDGKFDTIVFNPPIRTGKKVIYQMFLEARSHLNDNGQFIIVIRKDQGALSAHEYIQSIFDTGELLFRKHGYHIYRYSIRS